MHEGTIYAYRSQAQNRVRFLITYFLIWYIPLELALSVQANLYRIFWYLQLVTPFYCLVKCNIWLLLATILLYVFLMRRIQPGTFQVWQPKVVNMFLIDKLLGLLCVWNYTTNTDMLYVSCQCICNWFTDYISLCTSAVALNSNNHAPCCSVWPGGAIYTLIIHSNTFWCLSNKIHLLYMRAKTGDGELVCDLFLIN